MAQHNILGKRGEDEAAKYLETSGYIIVERNWRYNRIEIDIVAKNTDFIIFVEVKTRASSHWGQPEESVDNKRIKRLVEAADYYVQEHNYNLPVRFDIVSVLINDNGFLINHIDDAFWAPVD